MLKRSKKELYNNTISLKLFHIALGLLYYYIEVRLDTFI